ncbi:PP2C family protein-serine/threonine phosphatase [Streptomyces goshikiensis]|uniref:PP2C family protein-serine/threonine phosphatase n=2 Tax=Streptomyces goshikiensis TaxID=1942 RepID=UPI003653B450
MTISMPACAVPAVGVASRTGTDGTNADAAHAFHASTGAVGAAVIDGIGHSDQLHALVPVLAVAAARTAAIRWPLAGLLTAGLLTCDPGHDDARPSAVAVVARVQAGEPTTLAWAGDARAYGWDPQHQLLTRYTTDHTVAAYLAAYGIEEDIAGEFSSQIRVHLTDVTPATAHQALIPCGHLVVLTSDGVHDQIEPDDLEAVIRTHQHDSQRLADTLVAAAEPNEAGYRDDATALVIIPAQTTPSG